MFIHSKYLLNALNLIAILLVTCLSVFLSSGQEISSIKSKEIKDSFESDILCTTLKKSLNNCPDVGLLTAYLLLKSKVDYTFPLLVSATAKKEDENGNIYKLNDNHHHSDWRISGYVIAGSQDVLDYIHVRCDGTDKKIKILECTQINGGFYLISFKLPNDLDIGEFALIEMSFASSYYSYIITSYASYCLLEINLASLP